MNNQFIDISQFKQGNKVPLTDEQKFKSKREEHAIEIRRTARNQELNKKRQLEQTARNDVQNNELAAIITQAQKKDFTNNDFQEILTSIFSTNSLNQHYGVIGLRKILSVEENPPIQMVIDANLIPILITFMKSTSTTMQLEAAWALTNIASGTSLQTQAIIDKGAIPIFCQLLQSTKPEIADQAVWAIGNIAGDCGIYRDMILKCGGQNHLINIIQTTQSKSTIKHGTWALSNLCRGRPLPKFEYVQNTIPVFAKVIKEETDSEVLTDALWALTYLSDGDEARIDLIINTQIIPSLVNLLNHPFLPIVIPCLRTLGNIVTGNDTQTDAVLQSDALKHFFTLMSHEKRSVRRETCWALSNITAGSQIQIHTIVSNPMYVEKILTLMLTDCPEIQREACWILSNACCQGKPEDTKSLIEQKLMETLVELLKVNDAKTLTVVLEAISNVLKCGKKNFMNENNENIFAKKLEALGAIPLIEKLQLHQSNDVYKKSVKILENNFELESIL